MSDEMSIKLANSIWQASQTLNRIKDGKKRLQIVKVKPISSSSETVSVSTVVLCKALTLSGNKCKFKAADGCDGFCKKHRIIS
tara:strand:+ start:1281 stop:1529 length:249 start_codon:yes stop_codon:yes gene_type:complete